MSSNFRPNSCQLPSQTTDTTSLNSVQASEYEDAESGLPLSPFLYACICLCVVLYGNLDMLACSTNHTCIFCTIVISKFVNHVNVSFVQFLALSLEYIIFSY